MSKIFNFYTKNEDGIDVDRTWYESSNVKYSECLDYENKLKTLRVVFNNGTQYEYKDVNVNDYLLFREDESQGKAINKYIKAKNYAFEKLENKNMSLLTEELEFRSNGGLYITFNADGFIITNGMDNVLYENDSLFKDVPYETANNMMLSICDILVLLGKKVKLNGKNYEA